MIGHWVATIGLALDIAGVATLFFWPPPDRLLEGRLYAAGPQPPGQGRYSKTGLVLLALGFALQAVAVWMR